MLFKQIERLDDGRPRRVRESFFDYLQRCGGDEADRIRFQIEGLIGLYPESERNDIVGRIRSREDDNFRSSVFELALHAVLVRLGAAVEIHPPLGNGNPSRPDFKATFKNGSIIYLEAVLASESSEYTPAGQRRVNNVLENLNTKPHKSFGVIALMHGEPSIQPRSRHLIKKIHDWLDSLDPDNAEAEEELTHDEDGWHVTFQAIPIPSGKRGTAKSLISSSGNGFGSFDRSNGIRDAIVKKANKYGQLQAPLIVAVNSDCSSLDSNEEANALYGELSYNFIPDRPDVRPRHSRLGNGVWIGARGTRYSNLAGTWIFKDLNAFSMPSCAHRLYVNPFAGNAIPEELMLAPRATLLDRRIVFTEGMKLGDFLGFCDE
jgi:hypothetical protein